MPTYGYRCTSCGHEFEVLQKMSDAPLVTCPKCSGKLQKKMYAAGVIFKGSGYYTTDYKNAKSSGSTSSNGSDSTSDKPAEATAAKSSESSSDKSPEKPAETKPAAESKVESKPSKSDSSD
jgi:putative FmdB family regulatory protein